MKGAEPLKPETGWMAFSWRGYPVWMLGVFRTRRALVESYEQNYGHSLARGGYRASRVRIVPAEKGSADGE